MVNIDDSDVSLSRFASPVVVTTRVRLLVVLSPPLLAELAARRLAPLDVLVVIAAEGTPVPAGHYDVVVRNVTLPAGVSADLVVDLPSPAGSSPRGTPVGELVTLDRLEEVADLLADRWPVPGS
ncbi:MAG: hypothetical protein K0R11_1037 [Acidimicrobiales bacterium]|nr:hypothetical protein [Acidimicrobiales bacterium]